MKFTGREPAIGYTERMNTLMDALKKTPLKRTLLPAYDGPCSVGVVAHPEHTNDLAVEVRLPEGSTVAVAPYLEVEGQQVTVLVRRDYRPVRALAVR